MIKNYSIINQIIFILSLSILFSIEQQIDNERFNENSLTILSWNIKMFPLPLGWIYSSTERTKKIIQFLNNTKIYDIIIFQELFSSKIKEEILSSLINNYPYNIELNDKASFFKINSGLWAISSVPIELVENFNFKELRNVDYFSSKGAHLYSVIKGNKKIYIINTHMQADYSIKYNQIRKKQYSEIKEKLIVPFFDIEIPLLIGGDFNISDSFKLKEMLDAINFVYNPTKGNIKHTSLVNKNIIVDYILINKENIDLYNLNHKILNIEKILRINPLELSDHYPIEGLLTW